MIRTCIVRQLKLENSFFTPSKIVCIGRNYAAHIEELGNVSPDEMVVFLKPNSSIGEKLVSSFGVETVHFETEICLLVEAGKFVAVAVGLDLTRRVKQSELKDKGLPWERCKAFDGAALFSEFVRFDGELEALRLELDIDGEPAQRGGVTDMLFPPHTMLDDLSGFLSLENGDVVMTGTPKGVGPVQSGAVFEARVFRAQQLLVEQRWVAH